MPKWERYLEESDDMLPFEKIKKEKKVGKKILETDEEKLAREEKEREIDEKRKFNGREKS